MSSFEGVVRKIGGASAPLAELLSSSSTSSSTSSSSTSSTSLKRVTSREENVDLSVKPDLIMKFVREFVQNDGTPEDIDSMERMMNGDAIIDVNVRDSSYAYRTALHHQALCGTIEAMEWLLTRQPPADVDQKDDDGFTALIMAIAYNTNNKGIIPDKVRLLLEYGANRKIATNDGRTPISRAKLTRKDPVVIELLDTYYPDIRVAAIESKRARFESDRQARKRLEKERRAKELAAKKGTLLKFKSNILNLVGLSSSWSWEETFVYCNDEFLMQFKGKERPAVLIESEAELKFNLKFCQMSQQTAHVSTLRPYTFTLICTDTSSLSSILDATSVTFSVDDENEYMSWCHHLERFCSQPSLQSNNIVPFSNTNNIDSEKKGSFEALSIASTEEEMNLRLRMTDA